ncbi:glutamate 5-kinase [Fusibacillus kribbianus]|uniref:Glutamate 5-kinase n=1 Tax=Fusibacillus kribbianus TaxID=3044208 RepID=A0AAP4EXI7_9FIRM|nr:glutamate 5-kinase [Ruminococcus sp. YH-rum2234]MDI9242589.1 glutamate 5-kinase [Ruminococcus sp. YH-rum2234]
MDRKTRLTGKKRIVIKIGSSSLTHKYTGYLNLNKVEKLARVLCDLRNQGMEVVLVSSGAGAVGRKTMGYMERPNELPVKQALAAVGQAKLMMTYQKLFSEYNQVVAQILMTKTTMLNDDSRRNARNTFDELLKMGVIPIVNENDTVATHEIEFGDNDRLSAIVAAVIHADLLILLSDIDGLYEDDPKQNPDAAFIDEVAEITDDLTEMGKEAPGSNVGTGGMSAKIVAARMATDAGIDMVITNGDDVENIYRVLDGEKIGTLFLAHKNRNFDLIEYLTAY